MNLALITTLTDDELYQCTRTTISDEEEAGITAEEHMALHDAAMLEIADRWMKRTRGKRLVQYRTRRTLSEIPPKDSDVIGTYRHTRPNRAQRRGAFNRLLPHQAQPGGRT